MLALLGAQQEPVEEVRPQDADQPSAPPARPSMPTSTGTAGADYRRYLAMGTPTALQDAYRLVADCRRSRQLAATSAALRPHDDKALRDMLDAETTRLSHACDDITGEMEHQRLALLERAAAAGVRDAAVELLSEGYLGDPLAAVQRREDPGVRAWTRRALDYLETASLRGDRNAIVTLAILYDNENSLTGRQPVQALKYLTAAQAMLDRPLRAAEHAQLARLVAQLSPQQAAAAQEAGRRLALEVPR